MYKIIYSENAKIDISNINDFIGADNIVKAVEFVDYIKHEILKLEKFPYLGTKETVKNNKLPNSRKYILRNYIAHYTILEKEQVIYITRVIHAAKQNYKLI